MPCKTGGNSRNPFLLSPVVCKSLSSAKANSSQPYFEFCAIYFVCTGQPKNFKIKLGRNYGILKPCLTVLRSLIQLVGRLLARIHDNMSDMTMLVLQNQLKQPCQHHQSSDIFGVFLAADHRPRQLQEQVKDNFLSLCIQHFPFSLIAYPMLAFLGVRSSGLALTA